MKSVLVIDDSSVFRLAVAQAIESHPEFRVIGTARDGQEGLDLALKLKPDIITCDLEMPVKDGLAFIRDYRATEKKTRIIILASNCKRGAQTTMEGLLAGADDFLCKAGLKDQAGKDGPQTLETLLIPRLEQFFKKEFGRGARPIRDPNQVVPNLVLQNPKALLIGSSTGGPDALRLLLPLLKEDIGLPILIAQHMPASFTFELARQLDKHSKVRVKEAEHNEPLQAGVAYVAPGDWHMEVLDIGGQKKVSLNQKERVNFVRPSVDILFQSAQKSFSNQVVAIVLTGMGSDGAQACESLHQAGAEVWIQDRESSIVWGMPGAVYARRAYHSIGPIPYLAELANQRFSNPFTKSQPQLKKVSCS